MSNKLLLLTCLAAIWMVNSCNSDLETSHTLDYDVIKRELLQDSNLRNQEKIIESIIQFYQKELPIQFSRRVSVESLVLGQGKLGGNEVFLDAIADGHIHSLREHLDPSTNIRIGKMADSQIVDEEYLIKSIRYALSSVGRYPWNKSIPDSIFLNYLLPYKVIHEYPGTYWSFLEPYYRDSLSMWASPSYTEFDARDARWIQRFTTIYPRELPMW